jgi:hypothetical protein
MPLQNSDLMTLVSALKEHRYPPKPPIDIFGVTEVGNQELAYSSALHWLLTDSCIGPQLAAHLFGWAGLPSGAEGGVIVQREVWLDSRSRPDLLIRTDTNVLAIEAKLFAVESIDQLRRYQNALEKYTPAKNKALIFLSPRGVPAGTHDIRHAYRVTSLSYSRLGDLIDQAMSAVSREDAAPADELYTARLIANGFKSIGGGRMHPDTHLGLWTQYSEELDDLIRSVPDLSSFVDEYERRVRALASQRRIYAHFEYYPRSWKHGKPGLREVKCYLSLPDEVAPKAEPCIVFGWYPRSTQTKVQERRPFVRLFVAAREEHASQRQATSWAASRLFFKRGALTERRHPSEAGLVGAVC